MKPLIEKYLLEEAISEAHLVYNSSKNALKMSLFLANKEAVRINLRLCKSVKLKFRIAQRNYARFMREHGKEFNK